MNRVLFVFTISFLTGILGSTYKDGIPYGPVLILCGIILIAGLIFGMRRKNYVVLIIVAGFLLGGFWGVNCKTAEERDLYPYINQKPRAEILITSNPEYGDGYMEIEGKVLEVEDAPSKEKIILYLYCDEKFAEFRMNDIISVVNLKVQIPREQSNTGGFNSQRYYMSKGIYFTASASIEDAEITGSGGAPVIRQAKELNAWLCDRISLKYKSGPGGMFKGMLLGDSSSLDDNIESDFRNSGLSHIMAVSGLHVSLLIMILGGILSGFKVPRGVRDSILILVLAMFAMVTGCSPSVIRASVMMVVLILSRYVLRQHDSMTAMALVALILMLINPMVVYDVGFELSFAATLGIVTMARRISEPMSLMPKSISGPIGITLAAQLGTLPMMILYFGYIPLLSVFANIVVSLLLVPVYLVNIIALIIPMGFWVSLGEWMLNVIAWIARIVGNIPFQILSLPNTPAVILGLFLLTLAMMISLYCKFSFKKSAILLIPAIFITFVGYWGAVAPPAGIEVSFINVGQGDSALVQNENGDYILIDNGTDKMARRELLPYLRRNGVKDIKMMFISHCHDDHCGGTEAIFEEFDVEYLAMPDVAVKDELIDEVNKLCEIHDVEIVGLGQGDVVRSGDMVITVVSPKLGAVDDDLNNCSAVFKLEYGESSYLFTGDAEKEQTNTLSDVDVDVLKIPHHGAKNAVTDQLLKKTTPEYAIISVGEKNNYGHPARESLEIIEDNDAEILRTDLNGTITILSNKKGEHRVTVTQK